MGVSLKSAVIFLVILVFGSMLLGFIKGAIQTKRAGRRQANEANESGDKPVRIESQDPGEKDGKPDKKAGKNPDKKSDKSSGKKSDKNKPNQKQPKKPMVKRL